MAIVEKSVLAPYTAEQMFTLVDDVPAYPRFLPWCGGSSVRAVDANTVHATVHINYHHIRHSFTTENVRQAPERIDIKLQSGPFRMLEGHWLFIPLSDSACKIELRLHYEFSSKLLEMAVGPVFHYIANNFVDAFVHRAEEIYPAQHERND